MGKFSQPNGWKVSFANPRKEKKMKKERKKSWKIWKEAREKKINEQSTLINEKLVLFAIKLTSKSFK